MRLKEVCRVQRALILFARGIRFAQVATIDSPLRCSCAQLGARGTPSATGLLIAPAIAPGSSRLARERKQRASAALSPGAVPSPSKRSSLMKSIVPSPLFIHHARWWPAVSSHASSAEPGYVDGVFLLKGETHGRLSGPPRSKHGNIPL